MSTATAYKNRDQRPWTRIEMLLALYDKAIEHLDGAIRACEQNDLPTLVMRRTRTATVVLAIRAGIETEYGDIPEKIEKLCEYVHLCLAEGTPERLASALRIMTTLREGFQGIRDEANRLESIGELQPIPEVTTFDATV